MLTSTPYDASKRHGLNRFALAFAGPRFSPSSTTSRQVTSMAISAGNAA
jgi:hypothetical protein